MQQIVNTTPFVAELDVFPDARGVDTLIVTLKATFTLGPTPTVAGEQRPIVAGDEYRGEPGRSSLMNAAERHLSKPGTDVLLVGSAHAPRRRPATSVDVSLAVGPIRKLVRAIGDRSRAGGMLGPPAPFVTLPLVYERAFGGADEPRNPVGVGCGEHDAAPNLEYPHSPYAPGVAAEPACFAAIAPGWAPRCRHAGTYDEAWRRKRAPYLPEDFDARFFQAAPPDQHTVGHLRGGEPVEVIGASPEPLRFALPACTWALKAKIGAGVTPFAPHLETVALEPDERRLCMLWRAAVAVDRRALAIDEVTIGLRTLNLTP
ncbi:MAG: DUF2169 domain-containing protein [Myxococcales bacterium]|nr:DUF2169 domain-containing protein [Myxococcales bacterium]